MDNIYTDKFRDASAPLAIGSHATTTGGLTWTGAGNTLTVTTGGNVVVGPPFAWGTASVGTLMSSFNEEVSIEIDFGAFPTWVGGADAEHIVIMSWLSAPTGGTGYAAMMDLDALNTNVKFWIFNVTGGTPTTSIGTSFEDTSLPMSSITGGSAPTVRMKLWYSGGAGGNTSAGATINLDRSINGGAYTTVLSVADSSYSVAGYAGFGMACTQIVTDTHYGRVTNFSLGPVGTTPPIGEPLSLSSAYLGVTQGDAYTGLHFSYSVDCITFYAFQQGLSHYIDSTYGVRDPNVTIWAGKWWVVYSSAGSIFGKTDTRILKILSSPDLVTWTPVVTLGPTWTIGGTTYTDADQPSDLYLDTPHWVIDADGPHVLFSFDLDPQLAVDTICEIHPTSPDMTMLSNPVRLTDDSSNPIGVIGQKSGCYLGGGQYLLFVETYSAQNVPTGMKRYTSTSLTSEWTLADTFDTGTIPVTVDIEPQLRTADGHVMLHLDSYGVQAGGITYVKSTDSAGRTWGSQAAVVFENMTAPAEAQTGYFSSMLAPFAPPPPPLTGGPVFPGINFHFDEAIIATGLSIAVHVSATGANVPGTATYNATNRLATFTCNPSSPLVRGVTYLITVSGATALDGTPMVPRTFSFVAGGSTRPGFIPRGGRRVARPVA